MAAPGLLRRAVPGRFSAARLRLLMALFFLALAIPTLVLVREAYSQLQWEALHRQRVLAEAMAGRIDRRLSDMINVEESRAFVDYGFLQVTGDAAANTVQRSPLSNYPWAADIPGLLGYFQIDARDTFSTPLLPRDPAEAAAHGVSAAEYDSRRALQARIYDVLSGNRLVAGSAAATAAAASPSMPAPVGVDESETLYPQIVEEPLPEAAFELFDTLTVKGSRAPAGALPEAGKRQQERAPPRGLRKEQALQAELYSPLSGAGQAPAEVRVTLFESEVAPFELSLLSSGHFVLYRKVWRQGQRYIQGVLIEQAPFIEQLVGRAFRDTPLAQAATLAVAYRGNVLAGFGGTAGVYTVSRAEDLRGAPLLHTDLSVPFQALELVYSVQRLPLGPGGRIVGWVAAVLALVLCGGIYLLYRLALRQLALAGQQQDFVSAVSHELKTPLTSIRMYGEMLKQGWADEAKKREYYEFIYSESERLSRLIENVLQLARMTRNELPLSLSPVAAGQLLDMLRSKIASQVQRAGFVVAINCDTTAQVNVDADLFTQIVINLVDNAIKFSAQAAQRRIELSAELLSSAEVMFRVRDYGPGIAKGQMKNIFRLFYRSENELTRETTGTGIGLALVQQLARLMGGKVDVVNCRPGAEFRLVFAAVDSAGQTSR